MEAKSREERDEFRRRLKDEWSSMWVERFDDRVKAEGIVVKDYSLLFMDRGMVIFASRAAKTPTFSDVVAYWARQGMVYSPDANEGGWGKFIRTALQGPAHSRARVYDGDRGRVAGVRGQLKKGGRGWLHK